MTVIEDLKRLRRSRRQALALLERRRECVRLSEAVTPGQARELERLQRQLDERAEEYAARAAAMEKRIDALEEGLEREVLRYRYLNGWSWRQIAQWTGYSECWVRRVHGRAVAALERAS